MKRLIKNEIYRSWDFFAIIVLSLLLATIIYFVPDSIVRIIIGIPFILFFPGYLLITTLFSGRTSIDLLERITLSLGLSIAIVALIGFGLNYTSFGISIESILWSLIAFNFVFSLLVIWRRASSPDPFLPFDPRGLISPLMKNLFCGSKVDKALTVILIMAILSSIIAVGYVIAVPKEGEHFTEFYVLGPDGRAADYPYNLTINKPSSVILGISNHEYRTITYTIEIWLVNTTYVENTLMVNRLYFLGSDNVTLAHAPANTEGDWTPQWNIYYNISVPHTGGFKIWFVLFKDREPFYSGTDVDYAGTSIQERFLALINGTEKNLSLNLNINVSA